MAMITEIETYFVDGCGRCPRFASDDCSARRWGAGLAALRALCRAAGLSEHAKWGHPTYMHAGRNIVVMGAFRDNFRLSFFEAGLMQDPSGVLERQGQHSQVPDMIRFEDNDDVAAKADIINAYLAEATGYAEAGLRAPKLERTLDWPDELITALDTDPELAEAFHALTPGRQKSYLFDLSRAKQSQTRINRIAKYRDKIMAGKGAMER